MTYADTRSLVAELQRRHEATQRTQRLPALGAAVAHAGTALFTGTTGAPMPTADTQFRIGSITKTFTAVLIMQLRDEGRLRLDDPLEQHIPNTVAGHLTLRALLSHTSGLTSEPAGPFWEATGRTQAELLDGLRIEDLVLPPNQTFHYSNVGYGLLGQVVERLRNASWMHVLNERVLAPLGLERTTYGPTAPHAQGWRVHPYADILRPEPLADTGAMAPAGQLWSTPTDLVRWGTFLADPVPEVLRGDTIAEMAEPVVLSDLRTWTTAYGLGFQLFREGKGVLLGHGGSMPGFAAALLVARREQVVGAAVTNVWGGRIATFVRDAVLSVLEHATTSTPWQAETVPPDVAALLGTWWYRGIPLVVSYRAGALCLGRPEDVDPTDQFISIGPDLFRGSTGSKRGERLRVVRDQAGQPAVLDINTWLLTREIDDPRGGP